MKSKFTENILKTQLIFFIIAISALFIPPFVAGILLGTFFIYVDLGYYVGFIPTLDDIVGRG